MNPYRHLTDEEVESLWVETYRRVPMTFADFPTLIDGDEMGIEEYARRQSELESIGKERNRRAVRRRKASGAATIWEPGYIISGGRSGCEIELTSWSAVVGLVEVGHVHETEWHGKAAWEWRVYNCPSGHNRSGECRTVDEAKAEVEKRVEKWFRNCGIDRAILPARGARTRARTHMSIN
jgi:hypothetical protein